MDHRGAPGSGNDGCWALPPFHERAPLASPIGLLDGRRLRCLRLQSSSPCHVGGNSAITPALRSTEDVWVDICAALTPHATMTTSRISPALLLEPLMGGVALPG